MSLDVIILAGGFAKRLRPVSNYMPKPLLHIDGVPVIEYVLRSVLEIPHRKVIVSTNEKFENSFRYWLRNVTNRYNSNLKIYLSVESSRSEEEKLGAIGGLSYTIKLYNLDIDKSDVLVVLGDNLYDFDLKPFVGYARRLRKIVVGAYDVGSKEEAKNYGVLEIDRNNKIVKFYEKPKEPVSTLVSVGIYYFPFEKINRIEEFVKKNANADAVGKFFEWLIKTDDVYAYIFKGKWFDIGTPDAYKRANEWASKRNLGRRWLWP